MFIFIGNNIFLTLGISLLVSSVFLCIPNVFIKTNGKWETKRFSGAKKIALVCAVLGAILLLLNFLK